MVKLLKKNQGFTLIELIVVIAIIGILTTISVIGFSRFQADSRDARRASSITSISEALEKYYTQNGEYPGCQMMVQSADTVTKTTLENISSSVLAAPGAANGTNSVTCNDIVDGDESVFAYVGDGSTTCATGASCLQFTLKYHEESTGNIISVSSRHQTKIATSGISVLTATAVNFTQINLSWAAVPNATSYNIQRATNAAFTSGLTTTASVTGTSSAVTGLAQGTTYYFRILPNSISTQGNWSNVVNASTWTLTMPAVGVGTITSNQVTISWPAITHAATYTVQVDTDTNFSAPLTYSGRSSNGTTHNATGLAMGVRYFFRVQAANGAYTSPWSTTDAAKTIIPTPTGVTATVASSTSVTVKWTAVSGATNYKLEYATNSSFTSSTSVAGLTGTSYVKTGLRQGQLYYFRMYTVAGVTAGSASATARATTSIDKPTGVTATVASSTSITIRWTAQSGVSTHKLEYATNSSFTSSTSVAGLTGTSYVKTGLLQGQRYYVRMYATNGATAGAASATASATTPIGKPAKAVLSVDSMTWATTSHHIVNYITYCPAGTTLNKGPSYQGRYQVSGFTWNDGKDGYLPWGFSDYWVRASTWPPGSPIRYRTNYNCSTAYASSPLADTTESVIYIN